MSTAVLCMPCPRCHKDPTYVLSFACGQGGCDRAEEWRYDCCVTEREWNGRCIEAGGRAYFEDATDRYMKFAGQRLNRDGTPIGPSRGPRRPPSRRIRAA